MNHKRVPQRSTEDGGIPSKVGRRQFIRSVALAGVGAAALASGCQNQSEPSLENISKSTDQDHLFVVKLFDQRRHPASWVESQISDYIIENNKAQKPQINLKYLGRNEAGVMLIVQIEDDITLRQFSNFVGNRITGKINNLPTQMETYEADNGDILPVSLDVTEIPMGAAARWATSSVSGAIEGFIPEKPYSFSLQSNDYLIGNLQGGVGGMGGEP